MLFQHCLTLQDLCRRRVASSLQRSVILYLYSTYYVVSLDCTGTTYSLSPHHASNATQGLQQRRKNCHCFRAPCMCVKYYFMVASLSYVSCSQFPDSSDSGCVTHDSCCDNCLTQCIFCGRGLVQ